MSSIPIQRSITYAAGIHQFITYGDGSTANTLEDLINLTPINALSITDGNVNATGSVSANSINNAQDLNRSWMPDGHFVSGSIIQSVDNTFQPFHHNGINGACTEYSIGINTDNPAYHLEVNGYTSTYSMHLTGGYLSSDIFIGFQALRTTAANATVLANSKVSLASVYDQQNFNSGIWDSITGFITAPVDGYYSINFAVFVSGSSGGVTCRKNASSSTTGTVICGVNHTAASAVTETGSSICQLLAGDTLSIWTNSLPISVAQYNSISCHLIIASSLVI